MSLTSLCGRHPLATVLVASCFVFGSVAVAGPNIQFGMNQQVQTNPNNPHHLPADMDPKSQTLSDEISAIQVEVHEEVAEASETIHSIAFQDHHGSSQQILDYTTGTSN
ncbi:hypothetical protein [Polynucleobacter asymbioticus]|uniref:hypothetical protein n=1 Tax=Polynucleobacter asymbioticus TaxID=576611 RepID=UPI0008F8BABB|nr:hypothetical protein [Polynucleobacter asymbioticus]